MDSWRRFEGLDLLRGLAAFGIVGCHLLLSPRTQGGIWTTVLCDMNVGVFAALSGYLMMLGRWDGWCAYAQKRAVRIVPIYAVWTVVYLCFSAAFQILDGGAINARYGDVAWWIRVLFWGAGAIHLWFLASLLYAQVMMAGLFRRFGGAFWIVVSLALISASVWSNNWYVIYPLRLLSFLMLGRGCAAIDGATVKRYRLVLTVCAFGGVALHFVPLPCTTGFLKDWIAVGPILMVFVAWSDRFMRRLAVVASFLGATSMGVYLLHPLFTKGVGIAIRRIFPAPYGVMPVVADWSVSWLCALLATVVMLRFAKLARFIK